MKLELDLNTDQPQHSVELNLSGLKTLSDLAYMVQAIENVGKALKGHIGRHPEFGNIPEEDFQKWLKGTPIHESEEITFH